MKIVLKTNTFSSAKSEQATRKNSLNDKTTPKNISVFENFQYNNITKPLKEKNDSSKDSIDNEISFINEYTVDRKKLKAKKKQLSFTKYINDISSTINFNEANTENDSKKNLKLNM